jgi:hypothetical protein
MLPLLLLPMLSLLTLLLLLPLLLLLKLLRSNSWLHQKTPLCGVFFRLLKAGLT